MLPIFFTGHKSSTKSPRRSRNSSKKARSFKKTLFSFKPFHSNSNSKEQVPLNSEVSKTDSLKENAVRSTSSSNHSLVSIEKEKPKRKTLSKITHGQNASSYKSNSTHRNEKTLLEKSERNIIANTTPKQEPVKTATVVIHTSIKSVQVHVKDDLHDPLSQVTSPVEKEESPEKLAPKQSPIRSCEKDTELVKPNTCVHEAGKPHEKPILETDIIPTSEENSDTIPMPIKFQGKGRKKNSKSPILNTNHHQNKLKRSFSDPTYSPRKDQGTTVLFQRRCQMYHAKVTPVPSLLDATRRSNYSVDDQVTPKDIADIEHWKREIKNSTSIFSDASSDEALNKMTSIRYRNSCIEHYYPLLKTKIPEEHVSADGSITLTVTKKHESNRDSGVVLDTVSPKAVQSNDALDDTEIESKDSASDSTYDDEGNFDTLKQKKEQSKDESQDDIDDSTLTRSSNKSKEIEGTLIIKK